jgi:DNA-binding NarL/FixJ family response regulator
MSLRKGLVVEDLPHVRRGLVPVLERAFPGLQADEAADLHTARLLANQTQYEVVLLDLGLPDGSGLELLHELRRKEPATLAVVTTIYDDDDHVFAALAAGADGYLLKEHAPDVLVQHLIQLQQGVPALSPPVARRILGHFRQAAPATKLPHKTVDPAAPAWEDSQLTARETEVLSLIGRGMQRAEVARSLKISDNTVAKYLKDIYRKLDISSRAEAALEARRRGLV